MTFASNVEQIKGVGKKTAESLHARGINSIADLLYTFPKDYLDISNVGAIASLQPGLVSIRGKFTRITTKRVRRGLHLTEAELRDASGAVRVIWFNQPYREKQLDQAKEWVVVGTFEFSGGRYQITNPSTELYKGEAKTSSGIVPQYRAITDFKKGQLEKIIAEVRPLIQAYPEQLPQSVIADHKLMRLATAIEELHFPTDIQLLERAKLRIAIDELTGLLFASSLNRDDVTALKAPAIPFHQERAVSFASHLGFQLTNAQKRAAWQIIQDIEKPHPMNRMLQGDVGSGKTAVAAMCAALAAEQGYQTAVMAPTELLARQHMKTFETLLAPHRMTTGLLVGSLKKSEKIQIKEMAANGSLAVLVGTHALIEDDVQFHNLGMVTIDEQHRFGVNQRQRLLQKGGLAPHMLSMTATPIPRSLQLTLYSELDVSILNELPAGRKPIITNICSPNSLDALYRDIEKEILAGRQIYVVCRSIEESTESKSVAEEIKQLKRTILSKYRIAPLHGRMSPADKQDTMKQFLNHEIDVLVATTVVEVGVDVPNATLMVIHEADMYGLAQLHQLRGRVGRSSHQSYCYLVTSGSLKPSRRLREMERSQDGFYLAQVDLDMRGPGEIYGTAQSGQLNLRHANIGDAGQRAIASSIVRQIRNEHIDMTKFGHFWAMVERFRRVTTLN